MKMKGCVLMKLYKTVPGPQGFYVDKGNTQQAFNQFASIINHEAQDGWEYHSMETISVTQKPGCMEQPVSGHYYMLIFVRDI